MMANPILLQKKYARVIECFAKKQGISLDEALALIRRVAPRRAYLTHMSHEMGLYAERSALLPEGVYLAYDGLEINVND